MPEIDKNVRRLYEGPKKESYTLGEDYGQDEVKEPLEVAIEVHKKPVWMKVRELLEQEGIDKNTCNAASSIIAGMLGERSYLTIFKQADESLSFVDTTSDLIKTLH